MNNLEPLVKSLMYAEAKYEDKTGLIWLYQGTIHYTSNGNHVSFDDMTIDNFRECVHDYICK